MHITVIGCGRWGSLIAWYLDLTGARAPGTCSGFLPPGRTTC